MVNTALLRQRARQRGAPANALEHDNPPAAIAAHRRPRPSGRAESGLGGALVHGLVTGHGARAGDGAHLHDVAFHLHFMRFRRVGHRVEAMTSLAPSLAVSVMKAPVAFWAGTAVRTQALLTLTVSSRAARFSAVEASARVASWPPVAAHWVWRTAGSPLEDETGSVNVIVWKSLREKQRSELLHSRLMAVYGVWQRDEESGGEVRHLIAQHLVNLTPLLGGLATRSREFH